MPIGSMNINVSVGGVAMNSLITRQAEGEISQSVDLPAGLPGTITSGTVTLASGHGLQNGDKVDVFWNSSCRYGCIVGSAGATSVALSGGTGTTLPSGGASVVLGKQTVISAVFAGSTLVMLAACSTQLGHADFQDASHASLAACTLNANEVWSWASNTSVANPISGTVTEIHVSNGGSAQATVKIGLLYDSTP